MSFLTRGKWAKPALTLAPVLWGRRSGQRLVAERLRLLAQIGALDREIDALAAKLARRS